MDEEVPTYLAADAISEGTLIGVRVGQPLREHGLGGTRAGAGGGHKRLDKTLSYHDQESFFLSDVHVALLYTTPYIRCQHV